MVAQDGTVNPAVGGWNEALEELHRRIAGRFACSEARERVKRYLVGLLGRVERKNGWQLAEAIGDKDPQGVQRLLNSAKWDADAVRDDLREYVVEHLGDEESGVLVAEVGGGRRLLRPLPRVPGVAGGAGTCLRGDGPQDQHGSSRRTQEEDRAARRATARRCLV